MTVSSEKIKINMDQTLESIHALIDADLQAVDKIIKAQCQSEVELVSTISQYLIKSGGKRFRPKILLLMAKALGVTGDEHHEVACVIEFIHSATLLHDDVVDQSEIRRHNQSAHRVWGNEASVLVGDFLYSRAFQVLAWRSNIPLMQLLAQTTAQLAEGEVRQLVEINNHAITIERYLEIIAAKTGAMFAAASQAGAIVAQPDNAELHQDMYRYGMQIGTAFQIIDDVLDYQSNIHTLGKAIGKDFLEGKVTLPLILTLQTANAVQRAWLEQAIQAPKPDQLHEVLKIMHECHAFERARDHAEQHAQAARLALQTLPASDFQQALLDLCDVALARQH